MTSLLLDTSLFGAYLFGRSAPRKLVDPWIAEGIVFTSLLVYGETVERLMSYADFADRDIQARHLLEIMPPLPITAPVMRRYAVVRRQMRKPYGAGLIGDIDTLIAATALELGLTVVTTDRDFLRVPDLSVMLLSRPNWNVVSER